jgi:hypothetical protein
MDGEIDEFIKAYLLNAAWPQEGLKKTWLAWHPVSGVF